MEFIDLLRLHGVPSHEVRMVRHKPYEAELAKVLPWLASERNELFNAYQSAQSERVESSFMKARVLASFIATETNRAAFVGLYRVAGWRTVTGAEFKAFPHNRELFDHGLSNDTRPKQRWFDLQRMEIMRPWVGRLQIGWPGGVRAFCLIADNHSFPVRAISEDSVFDPVEQDWRNIDLTRTQLRLLPARMRARLQEWRGIYQIYDATDGKRYVGAAYGAQNLYGRWMGYAETGDNGNKHLKTRDPAFFRFSILERLSPDMEPEEVIRREATWKTRLHTRHPEGLNGN